MDANDAENAARYIWLRDHSVPPHKFYISVPDEYTDAVFKPAEVDAYIYQARKGMNQHGKS